MRIISALTVIRLLILVMLVPNITLAAGSASTNETKINLEKKENIFLTKEGVVAKDILKLSNELTSEKLAKLEEEKKKVEKKIDKIRKYNLPEGKFTINASAYTAAADECGKSDGITASGKKVKENETIACPKNFPFGTKIEIEGMGTFECQDRGGAIKGNKIDIYMETKTQAFAFGRQNLTAEIIE